MDIIKLAEKVNIFVAKENLIEPRHAIIPQYDLQQFADLVLEEAAKKCDEERKIYSSRKYTTDPLGGYRERFAAGRCAEEIRNMKSKEE